MEFDYVIPKKFEVESDEPSKDGKEPKKKYMDSPFKGSVRLKIPSHVERLKFGRNFTYRFDEKTQELVKRDQYDSALVLAEHVNAHVIKCDVSRVDDSYHYDSIEKIGYDEDCNLVLNALGAILMRGVRLGKS